MTKSEIDRWVEEQLAVVRGWKTLTTPLSGQVFIAPMVEPEKRTILRPDQRTVDIVAEARCAIVVAVADGYWSSDASTMIPIDLKPGDGVCLVRAEGLHDGTVPVEDPLCPIELLSIHYRMLIGKFDLEAWLRAKIGPADKSRVLANGEG